MGRLVRALLLLLALGTPVSARDDPPAAPGDGAKRLEEALALRSARRFREADARMQEALEASRAARDAALEDQVLYELMSLCDERGEYVRMEAYAVALVELRKRRGDLESAHVARIAQASAADSLGDVARALNLVHGAEGWFRANGRVRLAGYALASKAFLLGNVADYAAAIRAAEEARRILVGDEQLFPYATAVLSALHLETGDYASAVAMDRAIVDAPGQSAGERANTLARIAVGQFRLGDLDGAAASLRRSLEAFAEAEDANGVAAALLHLGLVARERARLDRRRAKAHRQEALRFFEESREVPRVRAAIAAEAAARRAWTLADLGRIEEARTAAAQAVLEAERIQDRSVAWTAEQASAVVDLARRDRVSALAHVRRAARYVNEIGDGLAENEQSQFLAGEVRATFDTGVDIALAMRDPDVLLEFLELGRGSVLLEGLGGRRALRGVDIPKVLADRERDAHLRVVATRRELAHTVEEGIRGPALQAALTAHADAERRLDEVVDEIQRVQKRAADLAWPVAAKVSELQATLSPLQAFVMYELRPGRNAIALVVGKSSARIVPLGATREIEAACARARDVDASAEELGESLVALARLVLEPLRVEPSVRTLLVSPDGALAFAPFPGLASVAAGPLRSIALVPTGSTYRVLAEDRIKRGDRILALGDPRYSVADAGTKDGAVLREGNLVSIPKTREEVLAITTNDDRRLLDARATESELWRALAERPRWRSVHLACHGLIDAEHPNSCVLALTPADGQDGYVTPREILRSRVSADLVVLSACDTALGRLDRGIGIVGFVKAFFMAEAPRVVASLWKVDDAATMEFMKAFYAALARGLSTAGALSAAQVELRKTRPHPKDWAAWVLWGLED